MIRRAFASLALCLLPLPTQAQVARDASVMDASTDAPDAAVVDAAAVDASTDASVREVPEGDPLIETPRSATEIAMLTPRQCLRALTRADVAFERVRWGSSGMATPVVVRGPIGGVVFRASRDPVVHETMDCLLALTLVRYARFLRARHVREVRHLSVHRPATPDDVAEHPLPPRHAGGLAIDAAVFVFDDGTEYNVTRDFHGRLGAPVCGPTARVLDAPESRALRSLFCDAARAGIFHVALSPNFNDEHRNHFHLEVARSVSWLFVR